MSWNFWQNGAWQQGTLKKWENGAWSEIAASGGGGGGGTGTNFFLHEGFEDDNAIIDDDETTHTYVPNEPDAITYTTEDARVGTRSLRLHTDYNWDFPSNIRRGTVKPIPESEAWGDLEKRDPPWGVWGQPFWLGFSLGLPSYWVEDNKIEQVFEFHRDLSDNPGDTNQEKKDYSGSSDGKPLSVRIDGTELHFFSNWTEGGVSQVFDIAAPQTLQAGNWYDIVMNIKWTKEDDADTGFQRVWVNDQQVVDYTGDTVANDVAHPRPPEYRIYKWLWDSGTSNTTERTYYFDEMRYADGDASYEDVTPGVR